MSAVIVYAVEGSIVDGKTIENIYECSSVEEAEAKQQELENTGALFVEIYEEWAEVPENIVECLLGY